MLQPQSRLWIDGTSTIRSYTCRAVEVNAVVEVNGANAIPTLLTGEKGVKAVQVTVPAERMDCGNGTMNDHMLEALKAKENPEIVFRLSSYDLAKGTESVQVTLNGTLSLGGKEKPITVTAEAKDVGNGALRVTGTQEIHMKEFGLKPPSLMFGTMKVGELVKVKYDLLLKD
jgi:polyisoprenoid-binding protein YceI